MSPLVHLNGSSPERLAEGYDHAARALSAAIEALEDAAPNARDYYPKGESAFAEARREHSARVASLRAVRSEIWKIHMDITEQVDARSARRAER